MALTCPPNNVLLLWRRRENASDVPRVQVPPLDLRPGENRRDPSPQEQLQHSAHTQAAVSMSHFEAAGADLSTEGSSNEDDFSSDISSRTCSSGTVLQSDCGSPLPGSVSPKAEYKSEGDGGEQCKVPARGAGSVTDGEDGRFEHLPRHTQTDPGALAPRRGREASKDAAASDAKALTDDSNGNPALGSSGNRLARVGHIGTERAADAERLARANQSPIHHTTTMQPSLAALSHSTNPTPPPLSVRSARGPVFDPVLARSIKAAARPQASAHVQHAVGSSAAAAAQGGAEEVQEGTEVGSATTVVLEAVRQSVSMLLPESARAHLWSSRSSAGSTPASARTGGCHSGTVPGTPSRPVTSRDLAPPSSRERQLTQLLEAQQQKQQQLMQLVETLGNKCRQFEQELLEQRRRANALEQEHAVTHAENEPACEGKDVGLRMRREVAVVVESIMGHLGTGLEACETQCDQLLAEVVARDKKQRRLELRVRKGREREEGMRVFAQKNRRCHEEMAQVRDALVVQLGAARGQLHSVTSEVQRSVIFSLSACGVYPCVCVCVCVCVCICASMHRCSAFVQVLQVFIINRRTRAYSQVHDARDVRARPGTRGSERDARRSSHASG